LNHEWLKRKLSAFQSEELSDYAFEAITRIVILVLQSTIGTAAFPPCSHPGSAFEIPGINIWNFQV
jgi:hypothetical protein